MNQDAILVQRLAGPGGPMGQVWRWMGEEEDPVEWDVRTVVQLQHNVNQRWGQHHHHNHQKRKRTGSRRQGWQLCQPTHAGQIGWITTIIFIILLVDSLIVEKFAEHSKSDELASKHYPQCMWFVHFSPNNSAFVFLFIASFKNQTILSSNKQFQLHSCISYATTTCQTQVKLCIFKV